MKTNFGAEETAPFKMRQDAKTHFGAELERHLKMRHNKKTHSGAEANMNKNLFIGRDQELAKLNELLNKKVSTLMVLKGRRRIGKTSLIEKFAEGKPFLQFIGLAPVEGVTAQSQRNEFSRLLAEQTNLPEIETDDWSKLFALLGNQVQKGRQIILLDEITWMAQDDPTFLSKLKNAWELYYKKKSATYSHFM